MAKRSGKPKKNKAKAEPAATTHMGSRTGGTSQAGYRKAAQGASDGKPPVAPTRSEARPTIHARPPQRRPVFTPSSVSSTSTAAASDDVDLIALSLPEPALNAPMSAYFKKCREKLGFVPNVLKAYAFDMAKLEAFVAMYNDLMLGSSGLSKLEREMIAVVVSSQNRCYYCLVAHGAAARQLSNDPVLGELMVMNYRAAKLSKRQRAMLDFAVKLTVQPWAIEENDRARLRREGFSDREIWDVSAVAGFFNMSNRVAAATDMRPNTAYHRQAR